MDLGLLDTGMAVAQMGVGIYGGQKNKSFNKKAKGVDDKMRRRAHAYTQKTLTNSQADVNRGAFSAKEDIKTDANDRGVLNSSIPVAATKKVEDDRSRRYNTLQDRKDLLAMNYIDEEQIRDIKAKQARFQQNMALIQAGLQGGASGVGSVYAGA